MATRGLRTVVSVSVYMTRVVYTETDTTLRAAQRGATGATVAPTGSARPQRHHSRTAQRFFFATAYSPRSGETADGVPTSSSQAASAWESP